MKKLIIMTTAVAMAIATSYGATASWKISNITTYDSKDGSQTVLSKGDAGNKYLVLCLYSADSTISADFSKGTVDFGADSQVGTAFTLTGSGGTGTVTGKTQTFDYTSGTYYYAVLYNSKGTAAVDAYDWYAVSSTKSGNPVKVEPTDVPLQLTWTTGNGYNTWTAAAPEPTSGLLLLLGMAGLALKRKRA